MTDNTPPMNSARDIPRVLLGEPRRAASVAGKWLRERTTQYDLEEFFTVIATITNTDEGAVRAVYEEFLEEGPLAAYERQFARFIPRSSTTNLYRTFVGTKKYIGLNRISLYCVTRLIEPEIVVETGVKWGEGSLFILEALDRNSRGRLYSYDIGIEVAKEDYRFPPGAEEVGFFVPDGLDERWKLTIGDSVDGMRQTLGETTNIDFFFHDSLHTYEHMMGEFQLAARHMTEGGVLMSEDIDANDAWDDFLAGNPDRHSHDCRFFAMQGIDHSIKEVGATRIVPGLRDASGSC